MLTRSFKIGMNAGHIVTPVIHVNQYDHDEQWIFTLVDDNGVVYTPSTGGIVGLKADGNVILNAGTVNSSGQVVINETQQMTAAPGDATYELLLDNSTHGCANFTVRVEPKPGDNATYSDSDLSLLQEAIDSTIPANIEAAVQDWMNDNLAPSQWVIDNTLSISGAAADAKKTGDGLNELKSEIDLNTQTLPVYSTVTGYLIYPQSQGFYASANGAVNIFELKPNETYHINNVTSATQFLCSDSATIPQNKEYMGTGYSYTNTAGYKYLFVNAKSSTGEDLGRTVETTSKTTVSVGGDFVSELNFSSDPQTQINGMSAVTKNAELTYTDINGYFYLQNDIRYIVPTTTNDKIAQYSITGINRIKVVFSNKDVARIGYSNTSYNGSQMAIENSVVINNGDVIDLTENTYKYMYIYYSSPSNTSTITAHQHYDTDDTLSMKGKAADSYAVGKALELKATSSSSASTPTYNYNGQFHFINFPLKAGDTIVVNRTKTGTSNPSIWLSNTVRNDSSVHSKGLGTYFAGDTATYTLEENWNGFTVWAGTESGKTYSFTATGYRHTIPLIESVLPQVIVAASNSADAFKEIADFVCDGVNDEVEINAAIVAVKDRVGTVLLCDGDYYIDAFSDYTFAGNTEKAAIVVQKGSQSCAVTIKGCSTSKPQKSTIHVRETAFEDLGSSVIPSVFSGGSANAGYIGGIGFNLEHLIIELPNANHKCICVNYQHCYNGVVKVCSIRALGYGQDVVPVQDCIGIRGWAGWSDGTIIGLYDTYCAGFYVGFQLGGEHVICERIGGRFNYYCYTFGEYPLDANSGAQVHPITLINCCDEHSAALPKFCDSGNAETRGAGRCAVDMISFNIEYYPLITGTPIVGATEETDGGWCGRIDYTVENNENNSNVGIPFWAAGNGSNFRTTNSAQKAIGTTALRETYAPNYAQQYFDTTLNKMLVYTGSAWVDMNGNAV